MGIETESSYVKAGRMVQEQQDRAAALTAARFAPSVADVVEVRPAGVDFRSGLYTVDLWYPRDEPAVTRIGLMDIRASCDLHVWFDFGRDEWVLGMMGPDGPNGEASDILVEVGSVDAWAAEEPEARPIVASRAQEPLSAAVIAALPQFDAEQLDAIADALVAARAAVETKATQEE